MTAHTAVTDGKLTNDELGTFTKRCDEIKRRLNEGTLSFPIVMHGLQSIIEARTSSAGHVIDLDANPVIPNGLTVEGHQKGGQFKWDAAKVALFLSKEQQNGKRIEGKKLRTELAERPVFNANLLDYLLKHPHLIPEEWKGKYIFFWGTIYRNSSGSLGVRCLYWHGGSWHWHDSYWLDSDWYGDYPAALRAS
jgi:hypothetical protein